MYYIMYYSQCQEDIFLNENIFKNKKNGTYIELGALDGVLYSNTKFFEDSLNWKGILIEPHPEKFKLLQINRPNNFLFDNFFHYNLLIVVRKKILYRSFYVLYQFFFFLRYIFLRFTFLVGCAARK